MLAEFGGLTSELNEMWSYVGKKAEPRWLWHAIDHYSGTVLAYVFGRRKDEVFLQLQELLKPFGITRFYTDGWGAYERHLDPEQHTIGKAPQPVEESPDDKAQGNFTDPELHIMRTNNKGWEYCGNAQASVDGACQIIVACDVIDAANDKQQAEPMAQAILATLAQAGIERAKDASGALQALPATLDNGYYSEAAVQALETLGFDPYIATTRQRHHAPQTDVPETPATGQERMAAKIRTPAGKALYARRKVIVEPVFGQIKEARGFRRFLLRGLATIRGEWRLVCLTHNLLKIWRYGCVLSAI
ncbi:MAG TPA: IS1 family transposase [Candidatus Tectomicrobia bacterium]